MAIKKVVDQECRTLGEFIAKYFSNYTKEFGVAQLDMDVTHGVEVETYDLTECNRGAWAYIYPYVEWSNGKYAPCHYFGANYYLVLKAKK